MNKHTYDIRLSSAASKRAVPVSCLRWFITKVRPLLELPPIKCNFCIAISSCRFNQCNGQMMFPSVESHPPETKGKIHSIKQRERKLAATFSGARACDERPLPLILSRALVVIKAEAAHTHTMFHPFRKNKHGARAGGRRKINSGAREPETIMWQKEWNIKKAHAQRSPTWEWMAGAARRNERQTLAPLLLPRTAC